MKLHEDETLLYELYPESQDLVVWFFTKCIFAAFIAAFFTFWCFGFFGGMFSVAIKSNSEPWFIALGGKMALFTVPVTLAASLVYCSFLRKTYTYYITNQRCVFHGGIVRRIERSVPYHKVTDVEMSQNIIERILGISSLKIFTPGTGSMNFSPFGGQRAEISFVGLKDNEKPATSINNILRKFRSTGE